MRGSRLSRGSRSGFATGVSRHRMRPLLRALRSLASGRSSAGGSRQLLVLGQLLGHGAEQLAPGGDELVDALGLQDVEDVVEVDAERLPGRRTPPRPGVAAVDGVAGMTPWSATAAMVFSGAVLTVSGATSSTT